MPKVKHTASGKCRDCKGTAHGLNRWDFTRPGGARCPACGGMLDRVGKPIHKRRTPTGKQVR